LLFRRTLDKQFTYDVKVQYNSIVGLFKQPGETVAFNSPLAELDRSQALGIKGQP